LTYFSGVLVLTLDLLTTQVFRDPSAWYHIVWSVDTTQATATNRVKLYVNGEQVTSFTTATYPSLNFDTAFNYTGPHLISGGAGGSVQEFFDGYLTEVNFIRRTSTYTIRLW
jgi:hypothetical protein